MTEHDWLAWRFEELRAHLHAVAYRMLGSATEADDAVQEGWLRLSQSGGGDIENLGGWLTTVVARVCLDMLRSRRSRREELHGAAIPDLFADDSAVANPEREAMLADSVGLALLIVLDTLPPAERTAFVLHDMFAVPFEDVGLIVGRSPAAARQLASRARRRVRGASADSEPGIARQRELVEAFMAASRAGDFDALLELLDPDAELRADATVAHMGAAELLRGATGVAEAFAGRARAARLVLIDGLPGAAWAPGGQPRVLFSFAMADGKITGITMLGDSAYLAAAELEYLDAS